MHGTISDPGMGPYLLRVELALRTTGWVFHTVRGGIDPGNDCCSPRFVVETYETISDPGIAPYPSRVQLALRTPG